MKMAKASVKIEDVPMNIFVSNLKAVSVFNKASMVSSYTLVSLVCPKLFRLLFCCWKLVFPWSRYSPYVILP